MKSELEKCLASEVFNGSDPELAAMTLTAKRLTRQLNDTDYADVETRTAILRQLFGSIGSRVHVDVDFHCEYGRHIRVGNNVIINMNCTFVDNNLITIGAGSVVTRSIPPRCVAVGNPCRVIRRLPPENPTK